MDCFQWEFCTKVFWQLSHPTVSSEVAVTTKQKFCRDEPAYTSLNTILSLAKCVW